MNKVVFFSAVVAVMLAVSGFSFNSKVNEFLPNSINMKASSFFGLSADGRD